MRNAVLAIVLLVAASLAGGAAAGERLPRIVNGLLAWDPPAVGSLLCTAGSDACFPDSGSPPVPSPPLSWCTGTLIGCETFLTAAHCVCGRLTGVECNDDFPRDPSQYRVFLQHAGSVEVADIVVHPDFVPGDLVNDVAVLQLAVPVTGIHPAVPNDLGTPALGSTGTIVGFGQSAQGLGDFGLKRAGTVVTADCGGFHNDGHVCWSFEEPVGAPGDDSATCQGDSGGPLFVDLGEGPVIAGITSRSAPPTCSPPALVIDQDVSAVLDFIVAEAGDDLGRTCGGFPAVGEAGTVSYELSGTLNAGTSSATHQFTVDPGASELRMALNAFEDDGLADFDVYVRAGAPATPAQHDCAIDDE
ncbi:MAG: trypsin-like serine protease, partial [Myxococcales bacterium]|nr:trypsin-like serine protease [Myxococcales bacterium]